MVGLNPFLIYESNKPLHLSRLIIEKLEEPFFQGPVHKYGWHRCNKALLQAAGYMSRIDRLPMPTLSDLEYEDIVDCYATLKSNLAKSSLGFHV